MIYDYQNCIDYAVEQAVEKAVKKAAKENLAKGLAEGEAKGEKMAKLETARNLKNKGIASEIISACTGLSIKEIQAL